MLTTDHILAGALAGEVFFRNRLGRRGVVVAAVAALIPDLDYLVIALFSNGPFAGLRYHRGLSHSILAAPLLAALVAVVACLICRTGKFGWFFLAALAGTLCQALLDWPTSYGTQLLAPLEATRYALDWLFIIDPYLTAILLVSLIVSWRRLKRGQDHYPVALRGLTVAVAYLLFMGAMHHTAIGRLGSELERMGLRESEVKRVACLPVPLVPFLWRAYYTTDGRTHRGLVSVMSEQPIEFTTIEDSPPSRAIAAVRADPAAATFLWFARFPVVEETPGADGRSVVRIYDARFQGYLPFYGWTKGRHFELRAVVDSDGQVISVEQSGWGKLPE
ncbi:MAG: hypothetical protein GWP05_08535 [Anaerolineaceae bacterium]|nr:hypothetical protein [Anaerolineaceae bacterium]